MHSYSERLLALDTYKGAETRARSGSALFAAFREELVRGNYVTVA